MFEKIAFIGIGLIGSSLARLVKRDGLANVTSCYSRTEKTRRKTRELGIVDIVSNSYEEVVEGSDLVMICTPMGTFTEIAQKISPYLKYGAIVSDVGSAKAAAIEAIEPFLPDTTHFVAAHPVAGTEFSGVEAGFPELFEGRWCIITPTNATDKEAVEKIANLWKAAGMMIEFMSPKHHDTVLSLTSHLPHVCAYTAINMVSRMEDVLKQEIIKFSAGSFRDFTRVASSDAVMWRDIFLNNKPATLDTIDRFITALNDFRNLIEIGDGDELERLFSHGKEIRDGIIAAKQHQLETEKIPFST